MSDFPKSVFQKDGEIYLPVSWKEAYDLRHVLRQHLKRYPDTYLTRRTLQRLEGEGPDQGEATASHLIAFPRRPCPEESRVLITLKRGVIVAADFDWVEYHGRTGVRVRCDDDSTESYIIDSPSMAEYFAVELPEDATYEQKKRAVMVAAGWDYDEEAEWLQVDENGDALPEYETDQVINEWLLSLLIDVDIERHAYFAARIATEYTPGFEIWKALPAHQAERLGFRESDLGGPASSVPCVSIWASAEELQQVLELYGLPFVMTGKEAELHYQPWFPGVVGQEVRIRSRDSPNSARIIEVGLTTIRRGLVTPRPRLGKNTWMQAMLIEYTGICQNCVEQVTILVNNGEVLEECPECGTVPFTANRIAGIVYVASNPHQSGVKIGMTEKSIEQRLRQLSSTGVPGNFDPIVIFPSKRPRADEARVHEKLRRFRLEKEHFSLDPVEAALGAYRALNKRKPIFFDPQVKETFYLRLDEARIKMQLALRGQGERRTART